jgi:hypothetical protein
VPVRRDVVGADLVGREHHRDRVGSVGQDRHHGVAGAGAAGDEAVGDLIDPVVELAVGHGGTRDDGDAPGIGRCDLIEAPHRRDHTERHSVCGRGDAIAWAGAQLVAEA